MGKEEHPKAYDPVTPFSDLEGELISRTKLLGKESEYLPKFLFGYYSGESDRMKDVFRKYLKNYDDNLIRDKVAKLPIIM